MLKVKFTSGHGLYSYHDLPATWVDGDVREVSEECGRYLVESFPKNFTVVTGKAAAPPENKAMKGPGKNK